MSTECANGEELVAARARGTVFVAHAPEHHAARLDRVDGYSLGKIRSIRLIGISHVALTGLRRRAFTLLTPCVTAAAPDAPGRSQSNLPHR
jgi:hypothetical protein